jgi:hypothetical protein
MKEIIIRPYLKGDEVPINNAFNDVFGLKRSIEEWNWKFRPDKDASKIIVAAHKDGYIAAQYAAVFIDIQIEGKVTKLSQGLDAFCRPIPELLKYRIFLKTAQMFYKEYCEGPGDVRFYYGVTGEKLLKLGKLALGYKGPVPIGYLYRETPRLIRPFGTVLGGYLFNRNFDDSAVDPSDINSLWKHSSPRYRVSLIKDSGYFTRRYITRPDRKYLFVTAYDGTVLRGLAVLLYDNNLVKIVDLLWDGEHSDTIKHLADTAWAITLWTGAAKLEMWLNNDEKAKESLIASGMSEGKNPYELKMIAVSSDPAIDADHLANSLYFTMGDTDMF